jgi:signal transduction histidine kinase
MAHEIKNPLVALKTFAQLLPERYDDADFRETFTSIVGQEVQRIDRIVNQLLNFARPARPVLRPLHLHEAVEAPLRLIEQPLRQKQIALVRAFAAPQDTVRGDGDLMGQVFLNILLNAIESMDVNGQLQVASRIIDDSSLATAGIRGSASDGQYIQVSIRDTGCGISADNLPHVFDPFFTTRSEGTGLGLSIAHGIVREHGGTIDVESEVGRGTTFHVIVPLCGEGVAS